MIAWVAALAMIAWAVPAVAGIVFSHPGGEVRFRANQFGEGGITTNVPGGGNEQHPIPARIDYYLDYWFRFRSPSWISGWGGKMPGFRGGSGVGYGCTGPSGNDFDGWSSLYMWNEVRDNQGFRLYGHHQDKVQRCGDEFLFSPRFTLAQQESTQGTWIRLTQYIRVNSSANAFDGIARVWMNGQLRYERTNLRWRRVNSGALVDHFYFDCFRGGSDNRWSVSQDTWIDFKNFYVLDCRPNFSGNENSIPSCDPPAPPPPPPPEEDPAAPRGGFVLRTAPNVVYVDLEDPSGGINANPATGFTVRLNGGIVAVLSAFCVSTTSYEFPANLARCPIVFDGAITSASDVVTVSYSQPSGNVVDAQGQELEAFANLQALNLYDKVLNIKTVVSASPVDSGRPVSGLFDGDFITETSSVVRTGQTTFQAELGLFANASLVSLTVGGDNTASKQCLTYDLEWRPDTSSPYTLLLDDVSCNSKELVTTPFPAAVNARQLRFTATGPSAGVQVFELAAAIGTDPPVDPPVTPEPPTLINRITFKGASLRGLHLK